MRPTWDWLAYLIGGLAILSQYLDWATIGALAVYGAEIPARFNRVLAPTVADFVCICIWLWQRSRMR